MKDEWWHTFVYLDGKTRQPSDHVEILQEIESIDTPSVSWVTIDEMIKYFIGKDDANYFEWNVELYKWYLAAFMLYEEEYGEYKE